MAKSTLASRLASALRQRSAVDRAKAEGDCSDCDCQSHRGDDIDHNRRGDERQQTEQRSDRGRQQVRGRLDSGRLSRQHLLEMSLSLLGLKAPRGCQERFGDPGARRRQGVGGHPGRECRRSHVAGEHDCDEHAPGEDSLVDGQLVLAQPAHRECDGVFAFGEGQCDTSEQDENRGLG